MTDEPLSLASEFPTPTREEWLAGVDKAINGADFERKLVSRTYDGIRIEPLYTPAEVSVDSDPAGGPAAAPFVRGAHGIGRLVDGWDVRQYHPLRSPADTNRALLNDLARGVTSIVIGVDAATSAEQLSAALDGVYLDLAPVLIEPGAAVGHGLDLVDGLLGSEATPAGSLIGLVGDPIGALARFGSLDRPLGELVGTLAERVASDHREGARWMAVDGAVWAGAGASDGQELGAALATGVAYLRALVGAGVSVDRAVRAVEMTVSVDADQFAGIAKMRAARWCWWRIATASGASAVAAGLRLNAVTSPAMYSQRDPWVNLLRATTASFAAAVGGAEAITVLPFDSAIGESDDFARRVARNTQLLLLEESQLARVVDPAGGSHYVEQFTHDLAEAAWAFFQAIEAEGGIEAALRSGWIAAQLDATWQARLANLARRKDPLTGVSEFPDIREVAVARAPHVVPAAFTAADQIEPLPGRRRPAPFEELRDRAEIAARPTIFSANLGPVATHTARATFAKNLFEVGGIEVLGNDGFESPIAAGAAFAESGARLAVICSSDKLYELHGESAARALKDSGAVRVYLAGNPGNRREAYEAAGVDEFVFMGSDVLAVLQAAHAALT